MIDLPYCKGCARAVNPWYADKFGGYCLDCYNCGVPERDHELLALRTMVVVLEAQVAVLRQEIEGMKVPT